MIKKIAVTLALFICGFLSFSSIAQAHVKWFAPYIVEASPQSILFTLKDVWYLSMV